MPSSTSRAAVSERERLQAEFDHAGRSCDIEGLPPPSAFARHVEELVVDGEITFGEAVAMLVRHHKVRP
jgi:hypothetical protein